MRFHIRFAMMLALVLGALQSSLALAEAVPGIQFMVKWQEGYSSYGAGDPTILLIVDNAALTVGASVISSGTRSGDVELLRLDRPLSGDAKQFFMDELTLLAANVAEDVVVKAALAPNDEHVVNANQWPLLYDAGINVGSVWDLYSGVGATVAVIDSGIRPHVDLTPNVVGGYDFIASPSDSGDGDGRDPNAEDPGSRANCAQSQRWHGTRMAGIIGAQTNNTIGVAGVAFGARIVPVRVLDGCGVGYMSDVIDAITWASGGEVPGVPVNPFPAQVINLSLSAAVSCQWPLFDATLAAEARNVIIVAAAGNGSSPAVAAPANCANTMAIVATDNGGSRLPDSNFGSFAAIAAPGETYTLTNCGQGGPEGDCYANSLGTSVASAHAAGVAALLKGSHPELTANQVKGALLQSSRPLQPTCNQCGAGHLDAARAFESLNPVPRVPESVRVDPRVTMDNQWTLTWYPSAGATHYFIQQTLNDVVQPEIRVTTISHRFTGTPRKVARHRVRACKLETCSAFSTFTPDDKVVVVGPGEFPVPPPADIWSSAERTPGAEYTIFWIPTPHAESCEIERRELPAGNWDSRGTVTVPAASLTFRGGALETEYDHRVSCCDDDLGCSVPTTKPVRVRIRVRPEAVSITADRTSTPVGDYTIRWNRPAFTQSFTSARRLITTAFEDEQDTTDLRRDFRTSFGLGCADHRVRACNDNGCSESIGARVCLVPPSPPRDVQGPSQTSNGNYSVSWQASEGATEYLVRRVRNGVPDESDTVVTGTSISYTGGSNGDEFRTRVVARGRFGESAAATSNTTRFCRNGVCP